jgi:predicted N-acetyltransferase YhbS
VVAGYRRPMILRLMTPNDIAEVERLTRDAYLAVDVATRPAGWPRAAPRPAEQVQPWMNRIAHLLWTDPGGCWVMTDDAAVVGTAVAAVREGLWSLATYAVRVDVQGAGVGRRLLDAALRTAPADAPGMICGSSDPKAVRRYRLAGFDLHPMALMAGRIDRARLPADSTVRDGRPDDRELLDEVDRRCRGSSHGDDHSVLMQQFDLVVSDGRAGRGYAYAYPTGGAYLLGAESEQTASDLLYACLARTPPARMAYTGHLTAAQQWAFDVAVTLRLEVHNRGFLCLRNLAPPPAYLPSGHFL